MTARAPFPHWREHAVIIVSVRDKAGQEVFHTLDLRVVNLFRQK